MERRDFPTWASKTIGLALVIPIGDNPILGYYGDAGMRVWIVGLAVFLSGCASTGGTGFQAPPADTNYGPVPDVKADAKRHFEIVLKDPESAKYRIGHVGKAYCNKGWALGGDVVWVGYAANLYINAKNSFGGYTGYEPYTLMWDPDGRLRKHVPGANFGNSSWAPGLCRWENGAEVISDG